MISYLVEQSV